MAIPAPLKLFVLMAVASLAGLAGAHSCNPTLQVCDVSEIEHEMKAASQRGQAFIQAKIKSSRKSAKPKNIQLKERVAAYDNVVKEQVQKLTAKYGPSSVSHKRNMVQFTTEGEMD
mmetsp:Transcript_58970/g.163110  ORF Transcript_58970/g.163110 Transcript_58970/m.163110 type:complete len:116 (-) Transcript_58970:175-522(-)